MQKELPDVLFSDLLGWTAGEIGKLPDGTKVSVSGSIGLTGQVQIFAHPLPKRVRKEGTFGVWVLRIVAGRVRLSHKKVPMQERLRAVHREQLLLLGCFKTMSSPPAAQRLTWTNRCTRILLTARFFKPVSFGYNTRATNGHRVGPQNRWPQAFVRLNEAQTSRASQNDSDRLRMRSSLTDNRPLLSDRKRVRWPSAETRCWQLPLHSVRQCPWTDFDCEGRRILARACSRTSPAVSGCETSFGSRCMGHLHRVRH